MKFAYCSLLMKGDAYLPGALTMGYSMRQVASKNLQDQNSSNSSVDIIIMVTNDVSKEAKYLLSKVFDHVIDIPYISYKTFRIFYKAHITKDRYSSWMGASYTKWNALNLTQYDKILLLDADVIAVRNIDDVFDFDTPAGIFSSPHSEEATSHSIGSKHNKKGPTDYYGKVRVGEKIPLKDTYKALNNRGAVVTGNAVLLSPNKKDFKNFIRMMDKIVKANPDKGFGFNTESGADEQSISYYYWTQKKQWTILPNNVNTTPWKLNLLKISSEKLPRNLFSLELPDVSGKTKPSKKKSQRNGGVDGKVLNRNNLLICQIPHIIHYSSSINVWNMNPDSQKTYDDINVWWLLSCNFMRGDGILNKSLTDSDIEKLKKIYDVEKYGSCVIKPSCFWCKYLHDKFNNQNIEYDHDIIDENNQLLCPRLKTCKN